MAGGRRVGRRPGPCVPLAARLPASALLLSHNTKAPDLAEHTQLPGQQPHFPASLAAGIKFWPRRHEQVLWATSRNLGVDMQALPFLLCPLSAAAWKAGVTAGAPAAVLDHEDKSTEMMERGSKVLERSHPGLAAFKLL